MLLHVLPIHRGEEEEGRVVWELPVGREVGMVWSRLFVHLTSLHFFFSNFFFPFKTAHVLFCLYDSFAGWCGYLELHCVLFRLVPPYLYIIPIYLFIYRGRGVPLFLATKLP